MTNAIKLIKQTLCVVMMLLPFLGISASTRQKLNFNSDCRLHIGDMENGEAVSVDDAAWYKQYAADTVERKPYQAEDGKIAYHEKIVQKLPNPPQRKDRM